MGRKSQGEPQFTKATYDKKRSRRDPPSPECERRDLEDRARKAAQERRFNKLVTRVGLGAALFPDKISPPEPIKRRI